MLVSCLLLFPQICLGLSGLEAFYYLVAAAALVIGYYFNIQYMHQYQGVSGWWHWTVVNIPKEVRSLAAGAGQAGGAALPKGAVMGRTDFGAAAFGGACPPPGDKPHRYQLTVWALNTDHLDLNQEASGALVSYMLRAHALGQASLTGYYGR